MRVVFGSRGKGYKTSSFFSCFKALCRVTFDLIALNTQHHVCVGKFVREVFDLRKRLAL